MFCNYCTRYILVFFPSQQADAPNTGLIPESDAVGVTVVLITCTYRGQEFIRIGYYVNNEYTDPELRENPPIKPDYTQVRLIVVIVMITCDCSFPWFEVIFRKIIFHKVE